MYVTEACLQFGHWIAFENLPRHVQSSKSRVQGTEIICVHLEPEYFWRSSKLLPLSYIEILTAIARVCPRSVFIREFVANILCFTSIFQLMMSEVVFGVIQEK